MNTLKHSIALKIIGLILLVFISYQCMYDEFRFDELDTSVSINLPVPLIHGSLSFNDLVSGIDNSSHFVVGPNGLLTLYYTDTIESISANNIVQIPEQAFSSPFSETEFSFPPGNIPADTFEVTKTAQYPFAFAHNEKIDSIYINSGDIEFNISSSFSHQARVDITIDALTQNNIPFTRSFLVEKSSTQIYKKVKFNLNNYHMYLHDSTGNDNMFLPVQFHVSVFTDGVGGINNSSLQVATTLNNLDFDAVFGYVGNQHLITQSGNFDLNFFNIPSGGNIKFTEPQINFHIKNSFGVPSMINLNRLAGFNNQGDSINLTYINSSVNHFRYAYPNIEEYGQTKDTTVSLDKDNSSISQFVSFIPSSIKYDIDVTTNPDNKGEENFIRANNKVDITMELALPLTLSVDNFVLIDTLSDILKDGWNSENGVDHLDLVMKVENGMPLNIDLQLILTDSEYNHLDTVFENSELPVALAATINPQTGETIKPTQKVVKINYETKDLEKIKRARHALFLVDIESPSINGNQVQVKILESQTIKFSLGANVGLNVNDN